MESTAHSQPTSKSLLGLFTVPISHLDDCAWDLLFTKLCAAGPFPCAGCARDWRITKLKLIEQLGSTECHEGGGTWADNPYCGQRIFGRNLAGSTTAIPPMSKHLGK